MKLNQCSLNVVGLNTVKLNGVGTPSSRSDKPTLDSALKAKLVGVWNPRHMTNDSSDRNIIKDLTGKGNDLEILNAAWKLNSGHGLYKEDFTKWVNSDSIVKYHNEIIFNRIGTGGTMGISRKIVPLNSEVNSIRLKISGLINNQKIRIDYPISTNEAIASDVVTNGILNTKAFSVTAAGNMDFYIIGATNKESINITIEQIPEHQGAVVTDGVEDMIVSKKPMTEMLEGNNEFTVISVIHQISKNASGAFTNYIRNSSGLLRVNVTNTGKTGIYGYTYKDSKATTINSILGDKNDYVAISTLSNVSSKYSIAGYVTSTGGGSAETSSVAYYGGFIAKGVLTTDEINQVIAYYNLDWWVEPDAWYDVAKQGITNENHATFKDQLIDFSSNERHLQCNNFGWSGNSGVGKWATDFKSVSWTRDSELIVDGQIATYRGRVLKNIFILCAPYVRNVAIPSFVVNVDFDGILYYYYYATPEGGRNVFACKKGINIIPASVASTNASMSGTVGFYIDTRSTYARIEQLPDVEGGLWHDAIDDYCQYVGDLGLKDYTVIVDKGYDRLITGSTPIVSSATSITSTPFLFNHFSTSRAPQAYSFGSWANLPELSLGRKIDWQSTYIYSGANINKGTSTNIGTGLTIGRFGSSTQYSAIGFYGLLLYPYSMNEFLIERQLQKRKFGTLYPKT